MKTIAFRSPVLRPLHPQHWVRPSGNLEFRVTQRFADEDFNWRRNNPTAPNDSGPRHNAVDIGNSQCDDPIVAMAAGKATCKTDGGGALGVILDHGSGVTTEYWHLNRQDVKTGDPVIAGQRIGLLGSTGLGDACHCHIVLRIEGEGDEFRDPEKHLFGAPLTAAAEDEIKMKLKPVIEEWRTKPGSVFWREGPGNNRGTFTTREKVRSFAEADSPAGDTWRLIAFGSEVLWMQRSALEPIPGTRNPKNGFGLPPLK